MRPLVVIPTYNESENIERMLRRIHECLPDAGVLVVDDGSPDGTADLVKARGGRAARRAPAVPARPSPGSGSAYRAGFAWGLERGYDAFIEMDADFSHDPAALPTLVAPLDEGFDVSIGSRYVEGGSIPNWAWHRHLLSRGRQPLRVGRARSRRGRLDGGVPRLLGRGSCAGSTSTASGPRATASRSR